MRAPPPIFHIIEPRSADFRSVADQLGLPYESSALDNRLFALLKLIPPDMFAYKAVVGGPPPQALG